MNGSELVGALREDILDDVAVPYQWSDLELLRYLNYAEVQACRRAQLIIDSSTAKDSGTAATAGTAGQQPLCELTLVAGQATYILSPKILQVKRCQLKSMSYPLVGPVVYRDLDEGISGWFGTSGTVGTVGSGGSPSYFLNEPGNTITFVQAPSAPDTAYFVVSRLPLVPITLSTSPEIPEQYHYGLLDWAAYLAFRKNDSDTLNVPLFTEFERKFTTQFGLLPDAYSERMRKTILQSQRMRPRPFGF